MLNVKRLAQVEVFTAILLTGIFVSSVSAVYIWGVPLIEKRQASAEINAADNLMRDIEKAISDVAQAEGTAQKTMILNLKGNIEANAESNSIIYRIESGHSVYPESGTMINDWLQPGQIGVVGSNKAGVIVVSTAKIDNNRVRTTYNMTYRELDNPATLEGIIIKINTPRNNVASAGQHTLTVFKKDAKVERGKSNLKGGLITVELDVTIA